MTKIDFRKVSADLGDIPTKKDVIKMLKRVEAIEWFKPQKKINVSSIKLKVNAIMKAFNLDLKVEVEFHKLDSDSAWASAWASAWDSAWASAWASARASARASAWASAWDSARASARDSAWASARASARDSAWASARASEFEVVKDLMKKKGYKTNPFEKNLKLWEMGLYPVGILKDKKFHIYYVPYKKVK